MRVLIGGFGRGECTFWAGGGRALMRRCRTRTSLCEAPEGTTMDSNARSVLASDRDVDLHHRLSTSCRSPSERCAEPAPTRRSSPLLQPERSCSHTLSAMELTPMALQLCVLLSQMLPCSRTSPACGRSFLLAIAAGRDPPERVVLLSNLASPSVRCFDNCRLREEELQKDVEGRQEGLGGLRAVTKGRRGYWEERGGGDGWGRGCRTVTKRLGLAQFSLGGVRGTDEEARST